MDRDKLPVCDASLARLFPFLIQIERHIGIGEYGFLAQEFVTYHSYKPSQGSRYELRTL